MCVCVCVYTHRSHTPTHTHTHTQDAVLEEGFSAQNVAYGMGGALLQKCNRDTMSFATKVPNPNTKP